MSTRQNTWSDTPTYKEQIATLDPVQQVELMLWVINKVAASYDLPTIRDPILTSIKRWVRNPHHKNYMKAANVCLNNRPHVIAQYYGYNSYYAMMISMCMSAFCCLEFPVDDKNFSRAAEWVMFYAEHELDHGSLFDEFIMDRLLTQV